MGTARLRLRRLFHFQPLLVAFRLPLKGFGGAGVLEIVSDHVGDTYRGVYTVKFPSAIYVLHAFQKKSKTGSQTPAIDMEMIARRLKLAEADYKAKLARGNKS